MSVRSRAIKRAKKTERLTTAQRIKMGRPLEVWATPDGKWRWEVYKKNQKDDAKPYASWFVKVKSPFTPEGELGDNYVTEIKSVARKIESEEE